MIKQSIFMVIINKTSKSRNLINNEKNIQPLFKSSMGKWQEISRHSSVYLAIS